MSGQLDSYEVRITPHSYGGAYGGVERTYEIYAKVNGETVCSINRNSVNIPPHMTEIEVLNRMTQDILGKLRDEDECTCCRRHTH